jgi:amino acid transporter
MFCVLGPGLTLPFIYMVWTPYLYPGSNYAWAVVFALIILPIIAVYWLFSVAMPRSGGEYVYVTRALGPALGLIASWLIVVPMVASVGLVADWGVTYGLADGFTALGITESWARDVGNALWTPEWRTILGTLSVLIGIYVWLRGARGVMRIAWAMVVLTVVIIVGAIAVVIIGGGLEGFITSWNSQSGTTYTGVLDTARSLGVEIGFTVSATVLAGLTYVSLNTIGSTFSANIAGEIRGVQRSQLIALFGSLVLLMVIWAAIALTVYAAIGGEFSNALAVIFHDAPDSYPAVLSGREPLMTLMLGFFTSNPVVLIGFGFLMYLTIWTSGIALGFAMLRNIFAWSFDRIIPAKFSELDSRYKSPWLTVAAVGVFSEVFLLLWIWAPQYMGFAATNIMAVFLAWILVGIAAILFPYRRRELFEAAPPLVKTKVAGVPLLSILGVVTILVCVGVEYAIMVPFFNGTNDTSTLITLGVWVILPVIIYYVVKAIRARSGVPLDVQFLELPPE